MSVANRSELDPTDFAARIHTLARGAVAGMIAIVVSSRRDGTSA
jgi:hypothetical protein